MSKKALKKITSKIEANRAKAKRLNFQLAREVENCLSARGEPFVVVHRAFLKFGKVAYTTEASVRGQRPPYWHTL